MYYVLAVSAYRMGERPYVLSGLGILVGYLRAMLSREERFINAEYLRYFRRFERNVLFQGKDRTIAEFHDEVRKNHAAPCERKALGVDEERQTLGRAA